MAGRASRQKGDRVERKIVDKHGLLGIDADRVPLSGAAGGRFASDVVIDVPAVGLLHAEVKARKDGGGFKQIENWLGSNEALFLVRDREPPLVVLPWDTYRRLLEVLVDAYGVTFDGSDEGAE